MLYRDNDSALPLIDLLERAGTPYRCRQVESAFFTSRVVRDVTDVIRFALDPWDGERFLRLYYKLGAGISRALAQEAADRADREGETILAYIGRQPGASPWTRRQCAALSTHLSNLLQGRGTGRCTVSSTLWAMGPTWRSTAWTGVGRTFWRPLGRTSPRLWPCWSGWRSWNRWCGRGARGGEEAQFLLSTIHSSKGLEYGRVILMDVADGIFPKTVPEGPEPEQAGRTPMRRSAACSVMGHDPGEERTFHCTLPKGGTVLLVCGGALSYATGVASQSTKRPLPMEMGPDRDVLAAMGEALVPGVRVRHRTFGPGYCAPETETSPQSPLTAERTSASPCPPPCGPGS